jgi:hypothetical protein
LQPDYVKSLRLPASLWSSPQVVADRIAERVESDPKLGRQIYDDERIPASLLLEAVEEVNREGPEGDATT